MMSGGVHTPGGSGRRRPAPKAAPVPDSFWGRRRVKRAAKKRRIKSMTRGRRVLRRSMILGTWLLALVAAMMVTAVVLYFTVADVPRPEALASTQQVATIEYSDGSTLARIGSQDRTVVPLTAVPQNVRWAVLAAEDRHFYSESAISITGTLRAAYTDLTGGDTQGGSGITQQYVKNAYLSNAQTLTRKLKELMIAVKLSREYSKDQILEFYLNTVYFGRGAYGIQAAAQAYFGENVQKLTTAQGALLAALLRAPSYYDPAVNPSAAKGRWAYVLSGMVATGHLTAAQEQATAFPKTKAPRGTGLVTTGWKSLLVNAVLADLARHGISENEIYQRGMVIRTTIDKNAQNAALSAINTTFAHLTKKQRNMKNALVAVQPNTGAVLAYYGGSGPGVKGYDGQVNYNDWAGLQANPPGSSFKPYVLATALGQTLNQTPGKPHVAINSIVDGSACKKISGTKICNDPGDIPVSSSHIKLSLAMKYSLNTTFDQLALDVGPSDVAATAHTMGVAATNANGDKTLVDPNGTTSFGIGIGDYPVTPLDQATGYATLANGGVRNAPFLVQSATDSTGSVVYRHRAQPTRAIDAKVANDVTITMKPIAAWSNDPLSGGRESAAKTGTEGISPTSLNDSDAWMVGFTPQVSAAVWVGTGLHKPIYNANGQPEYGADLPGKTWALFMDTYLAGKPNLSLPDKQQIAANGGTPSPSPTTHAPSTPASSAKNTSTSPTPSFSISTAFSSTPTAPPPSTPATSVPATPPSSPTAATSSPGCGGLLQPPCSSQ